LAEDATNGGWRVGALLENSGLLPLHAQSVVEELRMRHGDVPPPSLAREFKLAQDALFDRWDKTAAQDSGGGDCHVFVGPPGAGKTTALCKWLAQAVLIKGRPASVWRLDGQVANTAESLSVICEILGVPLERFQPAPAAADPGMLFIDLPGVNPADPVALATLAAQISQVPNAQVHLVLNGAYETSLLLAQVRAFAALPIADLIVTHLDEELRWGKLWNLVFGTNCRLRFLSAGQNIPGDFVEATPDRILERQFARK
jgi:flagellar biosynthesis protein FlhF